MVTQEQMDRYSFQKENPDTVDMLEQMKVQYCRQLQIPVSKIKTGKLTPLVNCYSGQIDRFIEE